MAARSSSVVLMMGMKASLVTDLMAVGRIWASYSLIRPLKSFSYNAVALAWAASLDEDPRRKAVLPRQRT